MKCPICQCEQFYIKDPDDAFETYEFECKEGEICFDENTDASGAPEIVGNTDTWCNRCAWHGPFKELKS